MIAGIKVDNLWRRAHHGIATVSGGVDRQNDRIGGACHCLGAETGAVAEAGLGVGAGARVAAEAVAVAGRQPQAGASVTAASHPSQLSKQIF